MSIQEVLGIEMNSAGAQVNLIACHEYSYYLVTWDIHFPHGCRAHIFKSKKNLRCRCTRLPAWSASSLLPNDHVVHRATKLDFKNSP